ncbi:MAG: hypothetical protein AAFU71_09960 [Cyanobacteria bacterium J06632_22]
MANLCTLGEQRRTYLLYKRWSQAGVWTLVGSIFVASVWVSLFATGRVTLGGVPYVSWMRLWQDHTAREAYWGGDRPVLYERLDDLGIAYELKQYYRDRISDPVELDQHIHQILYDRTQYVGNDYTVEAGRLTLKTRRADAALITGLEPPRVAIPPVQSAP